MTKLVACAKTVVILLLSLSVSALLIFRCSDAYLDAASSYPEEGVSLDLSGVKRDVQDQTWQTLSDYIGTRHAVIVRVDRGIGNRGADADTLSFGYVKIGIYGDVAAQANGLALSFMGEHVLDAERLGRLLGSPSPTATLGLDVSQVDEVEGLPTIMGNKVVVTRLDNLIEQTGTVNGSYRVLGLSPGEFRELSAAVAEASGVSVESMSSPLHGERVDSGLAPILVLGLAVASSALLFALFVVSDLMGLRAMGTHLLCGWSRLEFWVQESLGWLLLACVAAPLGVAAGLVASEGTLGSPAYLSFMASAGLLVLLAVLLLSAVAGLITLCAAPVAAIRNQVSRRVAIVVLLLFYLACTYVADWSGNYLDGVMGGIEKNAQIATQWARVSDLYILKTRKVGNDASSVTGQSSYLSQCFYNWYASQADEDGVYAVNTDFFTQEMLDGLREEGTYENVPSSPYRMYTASPNYLRSQGFVLDDELVREAHAGVRVYLVPSTLDAGLAGEIESYETRLSVEIRGKSDIHTKFDDVGQCKFVRYDPSVSLFNWDTDPTAPQSSNDSVILICTPENMTFVESMSLGAGDLNNSWVKLRQDRLSTALSEETLERFDLKDNEPEFVSTAEFVKGLTKTLWLTFRLFGGVCLFASVLLVALVLGLIAAYQYIYGEDVAVKRLMGYPVLRIYPLPFLLVCLASACGFAVMLVQRSTLGVVYVSFMLVTQLLALAIYVRANSLKQLNLMLKE